MLITAHGFGDVIFAAADLSTAADAVGSDPYGAPRAELDPERFPALIRVYRAGELEPDPDPAADREAYFRFGLTRILDGIERLIR